MADLAGRFSIAFDDPSLEWDPTWTALDQEHPSLVTSYSIDRGRQFELDRTDTGRATVELADRDGILDPTNTSGPYYGKIEPLLQAGIAAYNPITDDWHPRYRGFIEDMSYDFDPSQQVNRLTITLVDIFEILNAIEMQPGEFGDEPPQGGIIWFAEANVDTRIQQVLGLPGADPLNAGLPAEWRVVFSGNVILYPGSYSPGQTVLEVIQEAADGEFPGVASNVYSDRFGRLVFHGRLAKFDPEGVEAGAGDPDIWTFREFTAGDGDAVAVAPSTTAQIRSFAFNRGLSKVINQAFATPNRATGTPLTVAEVHGQVVQDLASIGLRGIRAWSAQDLLTKGHVPPDVSDDLTETHRFGEFMVANFAEPHNRVTEITFRSMRPGAPGAAATWNLLCRSDIADACAITVASPGGGGFDGDDFFIEGIHEQGRPLNADYDDLTVSFDLSPRALDHSMFPETV